MTTNKVLVDTLSLKGNDDSLIVICFDNKNNCDIEFSNVNRISLDTLKQVISHAEIFMNNYVNKKSKCNNVYFEDSEGNKVEAIQFTGELDSIKKIISYFDIEDHNYVLDDDSSFLSFNINCDYDITVYEYNYLVKVKNKFEVYELFDFKNSFTIMKDY